MSTLEKWTPLRDFDLMERRMRRFFEGFGFVLPMLPPADLYETGEELVVELEVPGFDETELEIETFDHTLVVRGKREEVETDEAKELRLHERLEREFERRFELPLETDSEHVTARYAKGILTLHVPKTPSAKSRKVEIGA